jgi:hypothetical protein
MFHAKGMNHRLRGLHGYFAPRLMARWSACRERRKAAQSTEYVKGLLFFLVAIALVADALATAGMCAMMTVCRNGA